MTDIGRKWLPFTVGNKFYIKPQSVSEKKERINIVLGSGRAFGSGEHETTRQCLELIETLPFLAQHKVLDFGTGTGILAIAAVRLNAGFVFALDNDFHAVRSCNNNIQLNHIHKRIFIINGDLTCINSHTQFDYLLANIYADIILKYASLMNNLMKKGGYILLSGIEWDYFSDVKNCFTRLNYQIVKQRLGIDYNSILYRKIFE